MIQCRDRASNHRPSVLAIVRSKVLCDEHFTTTPGVKVRNNKPEMLVGKPVMYLHRC